MFAKLTTKVESQELWLPVVFGGNPKYSIRQTEVELILTIAPMENIFNAKYLENGERYDIGLKGGQTNGLSIGAMTFDLG